MMKILQENPRYLIDSCGMIYDTKYNNRKICMWIDNTGYLQCNLYNGNNKVYRRVHRLIAETFISNPYNLYHFNGKNSYPVVLYDKDYNYIKTYRSIRALCNFTGFNRKTVSAILNNSKINNYNYNFEYAKEGPSTIEMVRLINSNNRVE